MNSTLATIERLVDMSWHPKFDYKSFNVKKNENKNSDNNNNKKFGQ